MRRGRGGGGEDGRLSRIEKQLEAVSKQTLAKSLELRRQAREHNFAITVIKEPVLVPNFKEARANWEAVLKRVPEGEGHPDGRWSECREARGCRRRYGYVAEHGACRRGGGRGRGTGAQACDEDIGIGYGFASEANASEGPSGCGESKVGSRGGA